MRSPLPILARDAGMLIALATVIGGATLGAARRGARWHVVAMVVVWCAIQEYAMTPWRDGHMMVLAVPLGGLVLVAIGERIGRWPGLVIGALALGAGLVAPDVLARVRETPPALPPLPEAHRGAPDVVVVVLDAVRADHLGAFGYAPPTSPRFDALADDGTLFTDAVAPATWSLPSLASLFTGRFPSAHGAHDEHPVLNAGTPTLAERFAVAGYETRAFTASTWVSSSFGMTRGFRWTDWAWRFVDFARTLGSMPRLLDRLGFGPRDNGGAAVATRFEAWLVARPPDDRPAFTFVDFSEAGFPYHRVPDDVLARFTTRSRRALRAVSTQLMAFEIDGAPPTDDATIEQVTAMYDAGVAYADALLGRVVDALRRRGTLDQTILVVLADHGELLGEHGQFGHGRSLYEPVLHVPLLLRFPPAVPEGRRIDVPASTAGVYATVLDLAGLSADPSVQVGSLRAVIEGKPHPGPVVAEQFATPFGSRLDTDDPLLRRRARLRAYRRGREKLMDAEPGGTFLFDLDEDPGEEHEVSMKRRLDVASLREELDAWRERVGIPDLRAAVGKGVDPAPKPGYVE
jgi:arylsulfatase A-like enzyme